MYVDGLDFASGHITTPKGEVSVSYEKIDGKTRLEVEIPDGIVAQVVTPSGNTVELSCATKSEFM